MLCPSCNAELSPEDIRKRVCSECQEAVVVGRWSIKMLLAGFAVGGFAVYVFKLNGVDGWLGIVLLSLVALLLILRARR